MIEEIEVK